MVSAVYNCRGYMSKLNLWVLNLSGLIVALILNSNASVNDLDELCPKAGSLKLQ